MVCIRIRFTVSDTGEASCPLQPFSESSDSTEKVKNRIVPAISLPSLRKTVQISLHRLSLLVSVFDVYSSASSSSVVSGSVSSVSDSVSSVSSSSASSDAVSSGSSVSGSVGSSDSGSSASDSVGSSSVSASFNSDSSSVSDSADSASSSSVSDGSSSGSVASADSAFHFGFLFFECFFNQSDQEVFLFHAVLGEDCFQSGK